MIPDGWVSAGLLERLLFLSVMSGSVQADGRLIQKNFKKQKKQKLSWKWLTAHACVTVTHTSRQEEDSSTY